ncbi:MAG: sensor histidine kinase [Minisyncoccota bacterium]
MREATRAYWKRFVVLVTGFARKYRNDVFIRTEVNVIGLQVIYAVLILAFAIGTLLFLYRDLKQEAITAIATIFTATSTPAAMGGVTLTIEQTPIREIIGMTVLIFTIALIFGYLIARFALIPARNALTAQKQFIGNIAHELRTPLTIVKTNTEIRLMDTDILPTARAAHKSNLEELDRISEIIDNLLTFNALIQPGQIPLSNIDVGKIVNRVTEKLTYLKEKKRNRIHIKLAPERVVWGNATAIEQIVMNIVRNAIQHTKSGEISIKVGQNALDMIELVVRDTGAGISPGDLSRVFEPFYRSNLARTRDGGVGSGLGLTIVKELVKLHRGRVSIQSTLGKGTTVTIALPHGHRATKTEHTQNLFGAPDTDFPNGRGRFF